MKAFLDTSVLVPVFYGDHPHHAASLSLFTGLKKSQASCWAHSLAELYFTLTRMPGKFRVSGEQVILFIGSIRERLTVISLDADEYAETLESFAALGVAGGAIYDALLVGCALTRQKQKSSTLGTFATMGSSARRSPNACGRRNGGTFFVPATVRQLSVKALTE